MAGIAAMETRKWKDAADHFQKSIDYRYMGARAYQLMGVSLKKSGDDQLRRQYRQKANSSFQKPHAVSKRYKNSDPTIPPCCKLSNSFSIVYKVKIPPITKNTKK